MTFILFSVGLGIALAVLAVVFFVWRGRKPKKAWDPPAKVVEARQEFERVFMAHWPWSLWITGCGISQRGFVEVPYPNEDPNEWCLVVYLKEQLPEGFALPEDYKGIPLLTKVTGEIKAL